MIQSIGIDSVNIARFNAWNVYSQKKLQRIFAQEEIDYCLAQPTNSAERFAARFAAKEAVYKALASANLFIAQPRFIAIARFIVILHDNHGVPVITNWHNLLSLFCREQSINVHLSLTHTKTIATAFVILEKSLIYN